MVRKKLTNKRIHEFLGDDSVPLRQKLYDSEVKRLYVQKLKTGAYFYFAYTSPITHKARVFPIGAFADGDTSEQARNKAKALQAEVISGADPQEVKRADKQDKQKTARYFLNEIYKDVQGKKKTGHRTIQIIENFLGELLDKPISNLSAADVSKWQSEQKRSGVKFTSVQRRYNAFKAMLNYAAKVDFITGNPIAKVGLESYPETEDQRLKRVSRRTYLEMSEIREFLNALDSYQEERRVQRRNSRAHGKPNLPDFDKMVFVDHVKPIMLVLFYTGFRPGDAIGLRWEHVNFNFSIISKVIEKTEDKIKEPQHFPISGPLMEVLKQWRKQQGNPATGLVFPSPVTGKRLDPTALDTPWNKVREYANLPAERQLYTLRHNFASHLVMDGVDLFSVAKLLGHSDVEMIIKHYGHLRPQHMQNESARFASIVENAGGHVEDVRA